VKVITAEPSTKALVVPSAAVIVAP